MCVVKNGRLAFSVDDQLHTIRTSFATPDLKMYMDIKERIFCAIFLFEVLLFLFALVRNRKFYSLFSFSSLIG
jgi:hypothetical protein